jgi:DNA (cytosine-5)-methyltransferase 1
LKYFDAFSGYGGFHLGIERAYELSRMGTKSEDSTDGKKSAPQHSERPLCIGYSEIDKYASAVYKYHFGGKNYGDISSIITDELPSFDLLVGGFPCQAFSIAGNRRGFDDTRGTLVFDVFRILKEKQPRLVLLENVKGLLSHDSGRTFKTIISSLAELGYSVEWQVLNAKNFGVPQNRERVFIIGHLGGFSGRQVFPISRNDEQTSKTEELPEQVSNTLRTNYSNGRSNETYVGELDYVGGIVSERDMWLKDGKKNSRNFSQGQRVYSAKGISATLAGNAGGLGGKTGLYTVPVLTPDRLEKRQNGRRFKTDGEPMFTLNTQDKHGVYDGYKIRRLTPTECERLMSIPDSWTKYGDFDGEIKEISDTQRYKLCGNGVVVNVVEEIIKRLYEKNM